MKLYTQFKSIVFPSALVALFLVACSSSYRLALDAPFGFDIGEPPVDEVETISTVPDPVNPTDPIPTPDPICDPLGGGDPGEAGSGLAGTLTFIDPFVNIPHVIDDFVPGAADIVTVENPVFLSRINKSTSYFSDGFSDSNGVLLKKEDGETLLEGFALFIAGQIKLGASDSAGDYEFAIMSDDGAVMYLDPENDNDFALWIDNDTNHSNKIGCASQTVHLEPGDKIPLQLGYFQAPRYQISLMLFWRTGSQVGTSEPFCDGNKRGNQFFFENAAGGSSDPTANYEAFLSRGWQVLQADNFLLPANVGANPCL